MKCEKSFWDKCVLIGQNYVERMIVIGEKT